MTLWGGRFEGEPSDLLWDYTVTSTDRRLLPYDIEGSKAHVQMLGEVGILTSEDTTAIQAALAQIGSEACAGRFQFLDSDEDVHSALERRLVELVGPEVGGKVHTARSRNDQVAVDVRMYLRDATHRQVSRLTYLGQILVQLAQEYHQIWIPLYTHSQPAQAISFGHHLLAYVAGLARDRERFGGLWGRLNQSPLGAGAGGGSSLPIDPRITAQLLGFGDYCHNSMDAIGSRDLVAEFIWCCAQTMVNISRFCEDMVLWSSHSPRWFHLPESFTTGSSALPQKRNPDVAELARGKAAGAIADLMGILNLQKGLAMSYNRDLQEDKEFLFRADVALSATLAVLSAMVRDIKVEQVDFGSNLTALDLAERLVERGIAFREAHRLVGELVKVVEEADQTLDQITAEELRSLTEAIDLGGERVFHAEDAEVISPSGSVQNRRSRGGGGYDSVKTEIEYWQQQLAISPIPVSTQFSPITK